jgi:hypothetical protein
MVAREGGKVETGSVEAERGSTWSGLHELLTGLDDAELAERLRTATTIGTGIGGSTARLDLDGGAAGFPAGAHPRRRGARYVSSPSPRAWTCIFRPATSISWPSGCTRARSRGRSARSMKDPTT